MRKNTELIARGALPFFSEGEPEVYGEIRGEVLGRPFRRFEVQVYGARRFGAVAYRFTGVLYEVELPRAFPPLHLAPRGWPTCPRARWPFLLALLGLSGVLLARHLAGLPVLKPGTSPLLLLAFPALYLHENGGKTMQIPSGTGFVLIIRESLREEGLPLPRCGCSSA